MTITIELTPDQEARLFAIARLKGAEPTDFARKIMNDRLSEIEMEDDSNLENAVSGIDDDNRAAIALLQSWLEEDATDDPEKIRQANEDYDELKRNMNANRAATY